MRYIIMLAMLLPMGAQADKIFVLEKGKTFTPAEDLQCMNNDTAKELISLVNLCEKECEIKIQTIENLREEDLVFSDLRLKSEIRLRKSLLAEKDKTIMLVEEKFITQLAKNSSDDGMWWKVTIGVVGGVVVGGVVGALGAYFGSK